MKLIIMITIYIAMFAVGALLTWSNVRGWRKSRGPARRSHAFWLIPYVVLSSLPLIGAFIPDSPVKNAVQAVGNIWLGFFVYYGGLLLIFTAVSGIAGLIAGRKKRRDLHGAVLCVSIAAALVLFVYGLYNAQQPKVVTYDIALDKPAEECSKMKVVLIADLHLGVNSSLPLMQKTAGMINDLEPDVVLVAGDIFNSSYSGVSRPEEYARAFAGIRAEHGVYAVYGNHDVEEGLLGGFSISPVSEAFRSPEMEEFFRKSGFRVLTDETAVLPGGIQLVGRIDGDKAGDGTRDRMAPAELLAGVETDKPVIVLEHEPIEYEELAEAGADIILSGHTHNGQIFPGNLVVPFFNENPRGLKKLYGADTVVTSGVGYYGPPIRVGTISEITVVNISFDQKGD
ncbi:MAG: metallophosphoesterase [Firmicutes bacterium]|nr:metallophosphoesterase [Bacillota bacterium]